MCRMKQVFLAVFLAGMMFCCSGCATILGGIIGHQSGELAAGLAIGAAVDFGDNIVNGVGQMLADDQKEFRQRAVVDSDAGTIQLPRKGFSVDRTKSLLANIQPRFEEAGWTFERTRLKTCFSFSNYVHNETWQCSDTAGQPFELDIQMGWKKDSKFKVKVPSDSEVKRSEVTLQIYGWLEKIVMRQDL